MIMVISIPRITEQRQQFSKTLGIWVGRHHPEASLAGDVTESQLQSPFVNRRNS
jgi:hypothetical protein